jgi:hypothetical protein
VRHTRHMRFPWRCESSELERKEAERPRGGAERGREQSTGKGTEPTPWRMHNPLTFKPIEPAWNQRTFP